MGVTLLTTAPQQRTFVCLLNSSHTQSRWKTRVLVRGAIHALQRVHSNNILSLFFSAFFFWLMISFDIGVSRLLYPSLSCLTVKCRNRTVKARSHNENKTDICFPHLVTASACIYLTLACCLTLACSCSILGSRWCCFRDM